MLDEKKNKEVNLLLISKAKACCKEDTVLFSPSVKLTILPEQILITA